MNIYIKEQQNVTNNQTKRKQYKNIQLRMRELDSVNPNTKGAHSSLARYCKCDTIEYYRIK